MRSYAICASEAGIRRSVRALLGGVLAIIAVPLLLQLAGVPLGAFAAVYRDGLAPAAIALAGLAVAARAVVRPDERASWALLAAAVAVFLAGVAVAELTFDQDGIAPSQPSWVDGIFFAGYPLLFAGVGLLLRRRGGGGRRVWLDAAAAGTGLASVLAALAFEPVVSGERGLGLGEIAIELGYPLLDLGLLGAIVAMVAFDGRRLDLGRSLLLAGALVFALTDTLYAVAVGSAATGDDTATAGGYAVGYLLLAGAAWAAPFRLALRRDGLVELAPPLLAATCAVGVLVYGTQEEIPLVAVVLAALAVVAALGRTAGEFRMLAELARSRHEALTDELTGLANRRLLFRALEAALASRRPTQLALLDIDGFKAFNDERGHLEGDRLLAFFGHTLAVAVSGRGQAFRLGGDEFCVLLDGHAGGEELLGRIAAAAGSAPAGLGSGVGVSWGCVRVPDEAADADAAMRLADQRMYAVKGERASAVRR